MKKKILIRKIIVFILLVILIIFLFLFFKEKEQIAPDSPNVEKPDNPSEEVSEKPDPVGTSYLNNISGKASDEVSEEVKNVIVEFLNVYYNAIKYLKENDMTYLFLDPNSEDALINQTALSLLIETRKLKPNDLSLANAKYDLEFSNISISEDTITLTVLEDNYLNFKFMQDIESRVYNIKNEFTLQKVDDTYKIVNYNKVQDFYVMITDVYDGGGKERLEEIEKDYLKTIEEKLKEDREDYEQFLNGTGITPRTCDHTYDRNKALEHALKWVDDRDPNWTKFDSNCQNFASQVLYEGGIPMDYIGSASRYLQWKLYSDSYNENEEADGYVYTWTYVPYFYTYAKDNTGYGLCADVDANLYYAEAGDIIHVGTLRPTRHALVVIGDYKIDGKTVDILVNSNTVDLENYPISAYSYPYLSLIKVYGWNE